MKARVAFGLLLLLVVMNAGRGQQQSHDGFWWVGSSESYRVGFASGYAMAMTNVSDAATFRCMAEKSDEAKKTCVQYEVLPYDFTQIRMGQLSEGVDEFYKDFRNKAIDINPAFRYVRDELKGKSPKELQDELELWRSHGH